MDDDDILEHYGKKGMKWGVINEEKPTGRERAKGKEEPKSEAALKTKYQKVLKDQNAKAKPLTKEEVKKNIIATEKKSSAKFEPSPPVKGSGAKKVEKGPHSENPDGGRPRNK